MAPIKIHFDYGLWPENLIIQSHLLFTDFNSHNTKEMSSYQSSFLLHIPGVSLEIKNCYYYYFIKTMRK